MSTQASFGLGGAVQGAKAGSAFGPPGAILGGIAGAIGGLLGGDAANAAQNQYNLAVRAERKMVQRNQAVQRRDMIRQYRIARAIGLAQASTESGANQSSGVLGALNSQTAQNTFNVNFFEQQAEQDAYVWRHKLRAGALQQQAANTVGSINTIASIFGFVGSKVSSWLHKPDAGAELLNIPTLAAGDTIGPRE